MSKIGIDELEALLDDKSLSDDDRRGRLDGDQEALAELEWLIAERALFAQRASRTQGAAGANWQAIAAKLETAPEIKKRWWARLKEATAPKFAIGTLALAGVAAAFLALYTSTEVDQVAAVQESPETSAPETSMPAKSATPPVDRTSEKLAKADAAIADAELAFISAVNLLDEAYQQDRANLSPATIAQVDEEFKKTRALLQLSGDGGQKSMRSRHQLLFAYGKRLRALQTTIRTLEENPL